MSWWGKVIGGAFGFILGGPLGALLGAVLGHNFDRGLSGISDFTAGGADQEQVQAAFFTATFSVMGNLAKSDGRVSEKEIAMARRTMDQMQLDSEQKQAAIKLFNQGKSPGFDLDAVLEQFRQVCNRRTNLIRMFIEIQFATALADGELHPEEQKLLLFVAEKLGFSRRQFEEILAMVLAQQRFANSGWRQGEGVRGYQSDSARIDQAYKVLGLESNATDSEVKKAYRRLIGQHHPDKLVSRGLPEEMMKIATEKTREIKEAFELIKQSRSAGSK
jgi:DnaJ like chaperone protein